MDISVLVVLYNKAIRDISCLPFAQASPLVSQIVVCDNSTAPNSNAAQARELGIDYVDMGCNRGISVAYNAGVRRCTAGIVCIFDDDTLVGNDYFGAVAAFLEGPGAPDIALPLVMAGKLIMSPCRLRTWCAIEFHDVGKISRTKGLGGINSGMAIRRPVFEKVSYDESLFLDHVDHKFIRDARAAGFRIAYLEGPVLEQNFSLTTDSASGAAVRLKIFIRDIRTYYAETFTMRFYGRLLLLARLARLTHKYHTLTFFGIARSETRQLRARERQLSRSGG